MWLVDYSSCQCACIAEGRPGGWLEEAFLPVARDLDAVGYEMSVASQPFWFLMKKPLPFKHPASIVKPWCHWEGSMVGDGGEKVHKI